MAWVLYETETVAILRFLRLHIHIAELASICA